MLKTINWPMTKDTSTKALKVWQTKVMTFETTFKHLLAIDVQPGGNQGIPNINDPIVLPLELLVTPLRKRFKFHFCGNRQTNSKEKVINNLFIIIIINLMLSLSPLLA